MSDLNVHIGAPKCLSTSIQAALNTAEGIDYLGFIPGPNPNEWFADTTIQRFIDCDIKYSSRLTFMQNRNKYEKYFNNFVTSHRDYEKWISCENLSTRFTLEEADCYEKLYRLLSSMEDYQVVFHMIFRKYSFALFSMYKELVSRKYDQSYKNFLDELCFFHELGIIDHIMPKRILDNFDLLKTEFPNIHLHCYFPKKRTEQFFDVNELSNLWKIKISDIHKNRLRFNVDRLRNLNKYEYSDNTLSNLMELHRYGLATEENSLVDYWLDRKIRKTLIARSQAVLSEWSNVDDTFEVSSIITILRENHPKNLRAANVTFHGDLHNLW